MYKALIIFVKTYWHENGGFGDWFRSPFVHVSLLVSFLSCFHVIDFPWRAITLSSLPTVLGFSLAAYTITFTLMGSALHRALSAAIDKKTGIPLVRIVNATFSHVVLIQIATFSYSIVTNGTFFWRVLGGKPELSMDRSGVLWGIVNGGNLIGGFLTIYSVFLLFSVVIAMFRLGRLASKPIIISTNSADLSTADARLQDPVTQTFRFKMVARMARVLRLYN